ncbi:type II toxin-antitoxin system RelE/ParE family toxin [Pigmentiphaga litoralis]|uniref:type II toxin-antitoxin system RelE/ParE family toxin n=1 Tax=Pigmentiphaga litoralis TaxID=516702 RepID=UPI003B42A874
MFLTARCAASLLQTGVHGSNLLWFISFQPTIRLDCCNPKGYNALMIKSFSHKGLERFFHEGSHAGIKAIHARKLKLILAALNEARRIDDVDVPSFRLHELRGQLAGFWAVTVQANWRITFRMLEGDVYVVDYVDYH